MYRGSSKHDPEFDRRWHHPILHGGDLIHAGFEFTLAEMLDRVLALLDPELGRRTAWKITRQPVTETARSSRSR